MPTYYGNSAPAAAIDSFARSGSRADPVLPYSLRTEQAYVFWIRRFIRFHQLRHPRQMGPAEVEAFLTHLATDRNVAPSTHTQASARCLTILVSAGPGHRSALAAEHRTAEKPDSDSSRPVERRSCATTCRDRRKLFDDCRPSLRRRAPPDGMLALASQRHRLRSQGHHRA